MSKKNKGGAKVPSHHEGGVPFVMGPGNSMQIRVDFSRIPEPAFYYYADALALRIDDENKMVALDVGRHDETRTKFADRIEIVMPIERLVRDFWKSGRDVETAIDQILQSQRWNVPVSQMEPPSGVAQTFFANTLFMAVGIGESSLDFYHLSARQVHFAKTGESKEIQLLPVVRVVLSTVLSKYFFSMIRPHALLADTSNRESEGVANASDTADFSPARKA